MIPDIPYHKDSGTWIGLNRMIHLCPLGRYKWPDCHVQKCLFYAGKWRRVCTNHSMVQIEGEWKGLGEI